MTGLVTAQLIKMIAEQVELHGTVVWFDPENQYSQVAKDLVVSGIDLFCYDASDGFLFLRRNIEPFWITEAVPSIVIYVPMGTQEAVDALIEYTTAGIVMRPGQHPPEQNTRLSVVARRALEEICPQVVLDQYVADAETGKLSLSELDELAENCAEGQIGTLSLIFNTGNPEEITLSFLANSQYDQSVLEKKAGGDLAGLFTNIFGIDFGSYGQDLPALKIQLARFVLSNELREKLVGDLPEKLQSLQKPETKLGRESGLRVVEIWRQRTDLVESYIQTAGNIEAEFGLGSHSWSIEAIQHCHTFSRFETQLQTLIEEHLIEDVKELFIQLAKERTRSFWALHQPEVKLRWEIIARAGEVLADAKKLTASLKSNKSSAVKLVESYTSGKEPWCKLDTNFRQLDRDFHYFDLDEGIHDSLLRLVAAAKRNYVDAINHLTEKFIHAYEDAGFELPGVLHQVEIYHDFIDPALQDERVAYFLVDALRYEMAQELKELFSDDWNTTITPALATPPTITEIGMAALLPGAEKGLTIVSPSASKLAALVSGETLKDRSDRVKFMKNLPNTPVEVIRLDQIAPLKDNKIRKALKEAKLIVVTASDEIDGFWESNSHMARRMQDDVFSQLQRGIRSLLRIGVNRVVITADHGYLSGNELIPGQGIDAPGGQTADLHRRVWVGKGGASIPETLRKPLSVFGLGGDFEIVTPYSLACFKSPGGTMEYFHGGLSLQELVIPILVVSPRKQPTLDQEPIFTWDIKLGSHKITSLFFSVNVNGVSQALFQTTPSIRVELRDGEKVISQPVSASHGFNPVTRDVELEFDAEETNRLLSNTVMLQITEESIAKSVILFILDTETGVSLVDPIEVEVDMLI